MKRVFDQFLVLTSILLITVSQVAAQLTNKDYEKALWMTTRFYGGQRATDKNNPEKQHNWILQDYLSPGVNNSKKGVAFENDGDGNYDLSGGWFDCGDHVFFGQTGFFAAYALLKSYDAFPEGYNDYYDANYSGYRSGGDYSWEGAEGAPNNIPDVLDEVKHATDFFIKAARNSTTFYYEKGHGDKDHKKRITAVKMQTEDVDNGGEPREMNKNPNGASMASMCGATLALMSRIYRPFDAAYADKCLVHAKYAYDYAKAHPGAVGAATGSFYAANDHWQNGYAMLLGELFMATNQNTYKTEALSFSTSANNNGDVKPNAGYTFDYSNTGELALYVLSEIGHPTAKGHFNTRIQSEFLNNNSYNSQGIYKDGGGWGKLRYVGNAGYLIALYDKLNGNSLNGKVYSNVDYILGDNSGKQSYVTGFIPVGVQGVDAPLQVHHRNLYHYEGNNNNFVASIPQRNKQFGALVGGALDGTYNNVWTDFVNTEVCVDYNVGIVGALAAINAVKNPVDPNSFLEQCSAPDLGEDVSLCGAGSVVLESGLNTASFRTFQWYRNGVAQGGPSASQKDRTVTQGGEWRVVVDSAGVCARASSVMVSSTLPAVSLGEDIDLCSPSSVTLLAGIDGSGINYKWEKDGAILTDQTTGSLNVNTPGTYKLTVSASGCSNTVDEVSISSSLPETKGDVFCPAHSPEAMLEVVNGSGEYNWYGSASSNNVLGSGEFFLVSPSTRTTYYVEDVSSFSGFVGPKEATGTALSWGEKGYGDNFWLDFTPTSNFNILSMEVPLDKTYSSGDATLGIEIRNESGEILGTFVSNPTTVPLTNNKLKVKFNFTDFEIKASWGANLRMALATEETETRGAMNWFSGSYSFPYTTPTGAVTINNSVANGVSADNFLYFFNWEVAAGKDCDRVPVVADEQCAVGTHENFVQNNYSIYPNPSTSGAVLSTSLNEHTLVEIFNLNGMLVDEFEFNGQKEFGEDLEKGVYFVRIKKQGTVGALKFIKK